MATFDYPLVANFGLGYTGRTDVYVTVKSTDGTVRVARTNTGVTELEAYGSEPTGIYQLISTLNTTWGPLIVFWDINGSPGVAATEILNFNTNIKYVNDITVTGDGEPGTEWGPA